LVEVTAETSVAESNGIGSVTVRRDISAISRTGWKSWTLVSNGKTVKQNIESKKVSAKPSAIPWSAIEAWNRTYSSRKTAPILSDATGNQKNLKLELALKYSYGGRVKFSSSYPHLKGKGRFLRDIRVVPTAVCKTSLGYFLEANVTNVRVRRIGAKTDPVAEATLDVEVLYGKSGRRRIMRMEKKYQISVKGKGGFVSLKRVPLS